MTGIDGQETADFKLNRAWVEITLPVGVVRAGRQPSHWGMGLLANHGDGFDDMFGDMRGMRGKPNEEDSKWMSR